MKFDIKKQVFACAGCGNEYDLQTLSDTVKENDFSSYLERERATIPFQGMAVATCQQCGMEISFPDAQFSATCPMCGSTQVAASKQNAGIPPDGVIPFKIDKQDAQQRFRAWVKSRWFAPNDFKNRYSEGGLAGLFLPFWTYDAYAISRYKGRGGRDRREKGKDGKDRIVTDWYPVSGVVNASFDDIQICASQKEENVEGILPYGTTINTKPFSTGYLSGYYAEVYKIKADAGFESAKKIMENKLRSLAARDIKKRYDRADVWSLITKYSNVTYKHVLLPLWSSAFGYKGKTYNYVINGETGKVSGSRPYSAIKITLAILGIAAVVAAWYMMTHQ
jgi:DNA-directed RNA polymerase subunit RPC12/RpoP